MNKTIFTLLLTISLLSTGYPQSGFLGRHFNFYFNARLCPAWTMNNHRDERGLFKSDMWNSAGVEAILNNRFTIGAEYSFYDTRYPSSYEGSGDFSSKPVTFDDISVFGYGIFFRHYFLHNAPLGPFYKIQLDYSKYTAYATNRPGAFDPVDSPIYGLQISFGRTYIIRHLFTFSPAFSTGFAYGRGKLAAFRDELVDMDVVGLADRKVRNMYYIGLGVAIGVIPF